MQLRPGQAALISLAMPGLSHVFLGKPVRAAVVFALAFGLFFAGYGLCTDRIWFIGLDLGSLGFLPGSLHLLIPEILNPTPYLLAHTLQDLDGPAALRHIRLPRESEHLGFWLMAGSGFASAFAAADACWIARGIKSLNPVKGIDLGPLRAALLTFMVPGSGHIVLGQKSKGLLVGGSVIALFLLGMLFSGGHGIDRAARPIWWSGQSPFGGATLLTALLVGGSQMSELSGRFFELGVVLCTCAGLLNVVLIVDSFSIAERRLLGLETEGEGKGDESSTASSEAASDAVPSEGGA
ncbi:MAG: DUF6677 family protein [Planctomycetota bacterium]